MGRRLPRPMATPRRIYRIYLELARNAPLVQEFLQSKSEKSGTVDLFVNADRGKFLARFGEEMEELCGVLDGTHKDSYLMESTQTFYWASCYAASGDTAWEDLRFEEARREAVTSGIGSVAELRAAVARLVGIGAPAAKPSKCFLLWQVADRLYRSSTPADKQWSLEQLMEADLQDMKKRTYLEPIIARVTE